MFPIFKKKTKQKNYNEVPPHTDQEWPSFKNLQITNAGEDVEKRDPSYIVGGNVNWCSHHGK